MEKTSLYLLTNLLLVTFTQIQEIKNNFHLLVKLIKKIILFADFAVLSAP